MSYELIAILVTAGFQSALLIAALVMLYRLGREVNASIRAYGSGNLRTTMRLEEQLRSIDQYVREHGAELDRFVADLSRHFSQQ